MPAPAMGVPPAGHSAHGKASWTLALGGRVSWGQQDSHRRYRQKGGVPLRGVLVSLALLEVSPPGALSSSLQSADQVGAEETCPCYSQYGLFLSHFSPGSSDKIDKKK